ncbi:MAG: IclR family transcriptional regulator [Paracoccaceae bacterium]|nr:IclR family transcriptional regulator [Paracoccaceae bacterium]
MEKIERYRAPALEKGLDIMELLSEHEKGLSQGEIAKALSRSSNEIYRMLTTLVRRRYISKSSEDDRFMLSLRLFSLSHRYPPVSRLINFSLPLMKKLTKDVWQSCHIVMENNGDIVVVSSVDSPGYWDLGMRVGSIMGLYNTSSGRVLAAFGNHDKREEIIARHKIVIGEPKGDMTKFYLELDQIRKKGFDIRPSNTVMGVTNMSFPIFDHDGLAVAAVTCPYIERIDKLDIPSIEQCKKMFSELASKLTLYYGGNPKLD